MGSGIDVTISMRPTSILQISYLCHCSPIDVGMNYLGPISYPDILSRSYFSQYMWPWIISDQHLIPISYLGLCSPIDVAISRHVTGINAPLPFHKLEQPAKDIFKTNLIFKSFFSLLFGIMVTIQKCLGVAAKN